MSDAGLVDALRRAHGAAAFAQAAEVRAVRELYRRHRAGNATPGPGGVRAGEFAAAEISMAVQISEQVAAALIDIGLTLERLPHTREAFGSGRIDLARVQVIVDSARGLSSDLLADLEKPMVEAAARTTPARLRQTARRWLTRLDGPGEQRRREQREDCRDIRLTAVQDGAAVVAGLLPAEGAQTVAMRLREMALQVCADDPRSMPQRRADALVALADGTGWLHCACGRGKRCTAIAPAPGARSSATTGTRRPLIQIGVSARTLAGTGDDPGQLHGYGPIDAELVRRIAERADFVLVAEQRHRGRGTHRADHAEQRQPRSGAPLEILDRTCRFPGCTTVVAAAAPHGGSRASSRVPAVTVPAPWALAEPADLPVSSDRENSPELSAAQSLSLCTHHHRLASLIARGKTRWQVRWLDADRVEWTSPTGDVRMTVDEDANYLFPYRDSDMPVIDPTPVSTSIVAVAVSALDPGYPIGVHAPIHRRLTEGTPEDCTAGDESVCY